MSRTADSIIWVDLIVTFKSFIFKIQTENGELFQREGGNTLASALVLTIPTDRLTPMIDRSGRDMSDVASTETR